MMQPSSRGDALLFTHGAGSGADHPTALAIQDAMGSMPVRRMEFPYRSAGRRPPDRAPRLIAAIRADAEAFVASLRIAPDRLLLGGRSMGGRMCSMALAEGIPGAGLVLLSYPLHPPGRPDRLRIEHLSRVRVPTLAISGTKDPFGTPDELQQHLRVIDAPVSMVFLAGARHDCAGHDSRIAAFVAAWARGEDLSERR